MGVGEGATIHPYPIHHLLMHVLPQTPDVDAVSGPACQVLDEHFAQLIPHGDAVVSRPYERLEDLDVMPRKMWRPLVLVLSRGAETVKR